MILKYKQTNVFYNVFGKQNANVILFLHGWGCDGNVFFDLISTFKKFYKCVVVDFPPFGKSDTPNQIWTLETYTDLIKEILKQLNLQNIGIIAHSFGGRVAIKISSCYNCVDRLLLTGSAGLKPKRNFMYILKLRFYKIFKNILPLKNFGSHDYKLLHGKMKQTFVNIVNTHQENDCKSIKAKTLLIYGENDRETPLYMAKKFNQLIKDSKLIVYKNSGHYAFMEKSEQFFDDAITFFKTD